MGVRQSPDNSLGLSQLQHGFIEAVGPVQNLGQLVPASVANEGVLRLGLNQIAQPAFSLLEFVLTPVEDGVKIARLVVAWINRQTFRNDVPGLVKLMLLLQQNGETDARV